MKGLKKITCLAYIFFYNAVSSPKKPVKATLLIIAPYLLSKIVVCSCGISYTGWCSSHLSSTTLPCGTDGDFSRDSHVAKTERLRVPGMPNPSSHICNTTPTPRVQVALRRGSKVWKNQRIRMPGYSWCLLNVMGNFQQYGFPNKTCMIAVDTLAGIGGNL